MPLLSIGFELETQLLAPVLVVDQPETQSRFKTVNADNFKHVYSLSQEQELDVYGDVFTPGYAFDTQRKRFLQQGFDKNKKDLELVYQRKGSSTTRVAFKTSTKDIPLLFSNAEFLVTFSTPVEVAITRQGILSFIIEKLVVSVRFIRKHLSTLTDHLVLENKSMFPYPFLSRPVDTTMGFSEGYDIGYLSQIPLDKVVTQARFVPQCTLGVPLVFALEVLNILVDWVREFVQPTDDDMVKDFDTVVKATHRVMQKMTIHRQDVVRNTIFLFLYSIMTKENRKTASLFTLRHTCQDLLATVLTAAEKAAIVDSLYPREAHFFRLFTEHPLQRQSALERQNLGDVGLIPFVNDERQAVYIEFRMLGWVLLQVLRKETLTLHDLEKLGRARRIKVK